MSSRLFLFLGVAIAFGGCAKDRQERPANPDPPPPTDEPPKPEDGPTPPVAVACATLDRAECLSARDCTMHWVASNTYECRASAEACETGMIQADKPECESRAGCAWSPGNCYCPFPGYGKTQVADKDKNTGGACVCGGGPPPLCTAATAE